MGNIDVPATNGVIMGDGSVLFSKIPCSATDGKSMSQHYPCQCGARTCGPDLGVCNAEKSQCLKPTEETKKTVEEGKAVKAETEDTDTEGVPQGDLSLLKQTPKTGETEKTE